MTNPPGSLVHRLWHSPVAWSWGFNGLRVASGFLLLPLLVKLLSTVDLGMHYVLLSLGVLAQMLDFGFGGAIWRAVCLALAGGREIRSEGLAPAPGAGVAPNPELLWDVLAVTRRVYGLLALLALLLLGVGGTCVVARHAHATSSTTVTWLAWAITLAAAVWEVYAGWWGTYLGAMNHMLMFVRLNCLGYALKIGLAAVLLVAGVGLPAVPLAGLVATFVQRLLARRACLRALAAYPRPARPADIRGLLARLWPNTWRQGVVGLSGYLFSTASTLLCVEFLGLDANARYGLSAQISTACQGMAAAWTFVKWPEIAQHHARGDRAAMRQVFQPRLWLQLGSLAALCLVLVPCAQPLLRGLGSNKEVLPLGWFVVLACNALLESQLSAWGMLIATGNRIPVMWPVLLANVTSLVLSFALLTTQSLGLGALVLAPLVVGCGFNYWFWPRYGALALGVSWPRFMFQRQR